jgi:photosystem II stability/assembly factor-like uncharacterized protein
MRSNVTRKLLPALGLLAGLIWRGEPVLAAAPWVPIGPPGGVIWDLAVDPRNPRIVYAGAGGSGIYKSVDAGASWRSSNQGLADPRVNVLAVDPRASGTLYAATGALPMVGGVFRSTDGGASWSRANRGLPMPPPFCGCGSLLPVHALAVDRSGAVYAGGSGVSKSTDGGAHWTLVTAGLSLNVRALAVDPFAAQTLYAATSAGIYKTRDGGASWELASIDAGPPVATTLALDLRVRGTLYAGTASGVFKSTDGGVHWRAASLGLGERAVLDLAVQPAAGQTRSTLFAATSAGVFRSDDGGGQWTLARSGLQGFGIAALAADPRTPGILWAGAGPQDGPGVFKTVNAGSRWRLSNQGLLAADIGAVAVDPLHRQTIFAGSDGQGVLRSRNGGITWSLVNDGLPRRSVQALALDPVSPALYAGTPDGVFKSTDEGDSWEAETRGLLDPVTAQVAAIDVLALDPQDSSTVYADGYSGLYVSHDSAATWTRLPVPEPPRVRWIHGFAVDPEDSVRLFVSRGLDLFRSSDGGLTWERLALPPLASALSAFAFDRRRPGSLYAGGLGGVLRSDDDGTTWVITGAVAEVSALAVDPRGAVYAATTRGVFRSRDRGATWIPLSPHPAPVSRLVLLPGVLYATVQGEGIQALLLPL